MDKEQCLQLIQLYEEYRHLWDARCPDYTNRRLKEEAWKDIQMQLNIPILDLKKKMESLLGSYRREKSREKKKARGPGHGETYKSNWYAYEAFKFLGDRNYNTLDHFNKDHAIQNDDNENILDNEETDIETRNERIEFLLVAEQEKSTRAKKRVKRADDLTNNAVSEETQKCTSGNTESKADSYEVFGQYVANELRKYDAFTLAHVKRAISEVIFEADTGVYKPTASHSTNYTCHPSTSIMGTSPMPSVSPMSNEMESSYLTTVKLSPPQHSD